MAVKLTEQHTERAMDPKQQGNGPSYIHVGWLLLLLLPCAIISLLLLLQLPFGRVNDAGGVRAGAEAAVGRALAAPAEKAKK